ncbi:MAG: alpha/beta fold hydrolase [Deferrisomatales bacterium]|nr:alpha/beta fold hydrolase [Deferrisomatales bacterium]
MTKEGDGPPVLLLPGLGCDDRLWAAVGSRLRERFTVLYPHTWGRSSLSDTAGELAELVDREAGGIAGVAGLSMGGYLALELLRTAPEKVRALALVDTTAFPDDPERVETRRRVLRLLGEGRFPEVLGAFAASVLAPSRAAEGPVLDLVLDMGRALGPGVFAAGVEAILQRAPFEDVLRLIRVPTLVLCGAHDTLTPPDVARRMAAQVPGARLEIVPDAGHLTPLENPEAVATALAALFGGVWGGRG